jgi:hypothetical protein
MYDELIRCIRDYDSVSLRSHLEELVDSSGRLKTVKRD